MALRYFEERGHVALYREHRPSSPSEVQKLILDYLQRKKEKPFSLAVDIGCGSGQSTRGLASHFDKVVGVDLSEAQIEEARKMDGPNNVSYRAEDIDIKMEKRVSWIFGFLRSLHTYQRFLKEDPENAKATVEKVEQRLLNALGVSSETLVEFSMKYFCVLASKPE